MDNILDNVANLAKNLRENFRIEILNKKFINPDDFYKKLESLGYKRGEEQRRVMTMLYSYAKEVGDRKLKCMFPLLVDIPRLWKWTYKDLKDIYKFTFIKKKNPDQGPSNTFAMALAAFFDIWGSVINNTFGEGNRQTSHNIRSILNLLKKDFPDDYPGNLEPIPKIFRHNLIHCFGKDPKGPPFDLNIIIKGKSLEFLDKDGRWSINIKKMHEQFLEVVENKLVEKYPDMKKVVIEIYKEVDRFLNKNGKQ